MSNLGGIEWKSNENFQEKISRDRLMCDTHAHIHILAAVWVHTRTRL